MQDLQKADNALLKYVLILSSAIAVDAMPTETVCSKTMLRKREATFACKVGIINWNFVFLGINHYVQTWTQVLPEVISVTLLQAALCISFYVCTLSYFICLALGLMLSPFILALVLLLYFCKRSWLPQNDPFLFKLQDYWMFAGYTTFAGVVLLEAIISGLYSQ